MSIILLKAIKKLKKKTLTLSAHVEERIGNAIFALEHRDIELATQVMGTDSLINELEIEIEEECHRILALYQPVAIDLRFVNAIIKINKDLEQIGDLAVKISKHTREFLEKPELDIELGLRSMTELVRDILKNGLNVLADMDHNQVLSVSDSVDEAVEINESIQALISESHREHPEYSDQLMQAAKISESLERVAGLVGNIGEEVFYIIQGKIIRHYKDTIDRKPGSKSRNWLKRLNISSFQV